jgi:hypothetical protein
MDAYDIHQIPVPVTGDISFIGTVAHRIWTAVLKITPFVGIFSISFSLREGWVVQICLLSIIMHHFLVKYFFEVLRIL